jgi:Cupin superfamily protein
MAIFDTLIAQWGGRSRFLAALGGQSLHGRVPAEQAQFLITWAELADLIMTRRLVPPDLCVVRDGRTVSPSRYLDSGPSIRRAQRPLVDPARLRDCLRGGGTLVVNGIDEMLAPLLASAGELSMAIGEGAYINLYATWGQTRGLAAHWDDHDVIVVQVHGEKHWDVYGPGTFAPLDRETDAGNRQPATLEWSGLLRPGDVLYLPRGWWHAARGTGPACLHLTYGFQRSTGLAYLAWLARKARHEMPLRLDLPRGGGVEDLQQHQKSLEECLVRLLRDHPLHEYLRESAAGLAAPRALWLDEPAGGLAQS